MKKRNKDTREKNKRGGFFKWFLITFVALMIIGAMNSGESDTTATTDNESVQAEASSEVEESKDRKSTRLNSSHRHTSRMPSSA